MAVSTTPIILKPCCEHVGGKIGNALALALGKKRWIRKDAASKTFIQTAKGEKEFQKLGIDTSQFR